jgi:L-lactate dehydrogenase complex protein LldF
MERLLPTLDDLALMLSLLPRSATGQKLSVYTQLIHSPRRLAEVDGATSRHLIIVDNGRSRLSRSGLREALYCIRCGACLNACPVFREIGGHAYVGAHGEPAPYPGPIGSIISPGLLGPSEFGQLAQASSLCGACKDACPVDIDLPKLLTRVRAGAAGTPPSRSGTGLSALSRIGLLAYGAIGASPRLFEVSQRLAAFGARIVSPRSEWMRLPSFTGWGTSKDFPRPAGRPFRSRWESHRRAVTTQGIDRMQPPAANENRHRPAEAASQSAAISARAGGADPVDRFMVELQAVGGQAHRTKTDSLEKELTAFLRERSVEAVLAWDHIESLDRAGLMQAGFRFVPSPNASVPAGITGCACAIAETGTLVLTSGTGQPMSTSLLPEVHVAIVRSDQIVWTLEEALTMPEVRQSSVTVLVTGPSRTADIEMTLTIGVHGPRELVVYILE